MPLNRHLGPFEGLLQAHDDLWKLYVHVFSHGLDGNGGHVAEELADLLVGVQDEQDDGHGREQVLDDDVGPLLHFESSAAEFTFTMVCLLGYSIFFFVRSRYRAPWILVER